MKRLKQGAAALTGVLLLLSGCSGGVDEYQCVHPETGTLVQQLVEDRTGLEVSILDPMTSINNFKELTAREPSCDLMYTWDGTILTTFLGLDTSDIPAGQSFTTSSTAASGSSTAPVCWARSAWTTPTPSASPRR